MLPHQPLQLKPEAISHKSVYKYQLLTDKELTVGSEVDVLGKPVINSLKGF